MIVVDTSVWSVAFRRHKTGDMIPEEVHALKELITENRDIGLPGVVLQELLSGLREEAQFVRLHGLMRGFSVILATEADHVYAAQISNICRKHGIAAKTVDCLIAAMTVERNAELFTTDQDFFCIAEYVPLTLYRFR